MVATIIILTVLLVKLSCSGHPTFRRFRSQTPFSTRTSHSNTYSHFLEDDEEITSIIREQVKCVRTEWCHSKGHINHAGVFESDHIADGYVFHICQLSIIDQMFLDSFVCTL